MSDIEKIKNLRDTTGLSFKEIKSALSEAGGDKHKAIEVLKARGIAIAQRKSSRQVKEGIVNSYVHATKKLGVIIELLCETDFVARNSDFQKLAHDLAMHIAAVKPTTTEEFLAQPFIKDQNITVTELINQHVAKLGENIRIGRFQILEI